MPARGQGGKAELGVFERFCRNLLTLEQGGPMVVEPFQQRMLRDYFDGARETLIILSKKNGKTTLLGALALYHLFVTEDAECVIGATSRDQATIIYDQACGFIARSGELQARLDPKRGYREIRKRADLGRIRVLAADVDTADGVIPTLALVDELHRAKSAGLYGIFRDGLGPRDGQMLAITSAGDHELSPLGQMRLAAHRLPHVQRKGAYFYARSSDRAYAMHEWALNHEDDTDDIHLVKQANPASWQTLELLRERHDSPSMLPWQWARFACGIWVSEQAWWMDPDAWRVAERAEWIAPGERITIGFDGSRFGDATALVACRLHDGLLQPIQIWEARPGDEAWEVPAASVDAVLKRTMDRYKVVRGYFDPPLWQSEIDAWAREFGEKAVMRYPTMGTRMMAATERFRTDVAAMKVPHVGDEKLTHHVLSAQVREARAGYWLTKEGPEKIDAAVAAVLAYEARCDAIAAGELADKPKRVMSL